MMPERCAPRLAGIPPTGKVVSVLLIDTAEVVAGVEACLQMLAYREETGHDEHRGCPDQEAQRRITFIQNV